MKTLICSFVLFLFFAAFTVAAEKKIYLVVTADPSDAKQSEAFCRDADTVYNAFRLSYDEAWDPLISYETLRQKSDSTKSYGDINVEQRCVVYNGNIDDTDGKQFKKWAGGKTVADKEYVDGKLQLKDSDKQLDVLTNLKKAIELCPAGNDDTLVVYWSGHGGFDDDDHFLRMSNGVKIKRTEILDTMKSKNVRLAVLLTDACADESGKLKSKKTEQQLLEVMAVDGIREEVQKLKPPKPRIAPLFDELFFFHKGLVDINASEKSQKAFTLLFDDEITVNQVDKNNRIVNKDTITEEQYMGIFTAAMFCDKQFSDYRIDTRGRTAAQDAQDFVNYYNPQSNRRGRRVRSSASSDSPLGVFEVNRMKRLTWNDLEERIQENVSLLIEKSFEAQGRIQTIAVWSHAEQIKDGLEERQKQDDEWKAEQYKWIQQNESGLRRIRGIDPQRLSRAIQIASVVLNILRMSGVNVPGIPFVPSLPGGGRIPRIPGLPF